MKRNNNHTFIVLSVVFIIAVWFVACNTKADNKKEQLIQTNKAMDMNMADGNKDMSKRPLDTNISVTDILKFVIKPTNEYVRSGVPLVVLQQNNQEMDVEALGRVVYDTRHVGSISARISGRIEKLYVRYKFQKVSAGQKVIDLYSPELVTAEENILFLQKNDAENASLINAAKQKLLLLGMSEEQLDRILQTQMPDFTVGIYSKYNGHIHESGFMENTAQAGVGPMRNISLVTEELSLKEGMYLQKGQSILSVYDPNYAWVILNFYGDEQAIIHIGSRVRVIPESDPNKAFLAKINFIEPFYRKEDKTVAARVYFDNTHLQIPIGSQVSATISGDTQSAAWLPEAAIVSLGIEKVVFIKHDIGFKAHKIVTGTTYKNKIQILEGLTDKDTVAANAQYLMDSESFIKVKE